MTRITPSLTEKLGEDQIRGILLINLNAVFEGGATSEIWRDTKGALLRAAMAHLDRGHGLEPAAPMSMRAAQAA